MTRRRRKKARITPLPPAPPPPDNVADDDDGSEMPSLEAVFEDVETQLEEVARELSALMAPWDAFDLVANFFLANVATFPNSFKPSEQTGVLAQVEYAALLLLGRGQRRGSADPDAILSGEVLSKANDLLRRAVSLGSMLNMKRASHPDHAGMSQLRFLMLNRRLLIRNPVFPHQERRTLMALYDHETMRQPMLDALGFSVGDALSLVAAFEKIFETRIPERVGQARQAYKEIISKPRGSKRSAKSQRDKTPKRDRTRLKLALGHWTFYRLGTTVQATIAELATLSQVPVERVQAFLDVFSIPFGEGVVARSLFFGENPVLTRPIMSDGDGHYLCTATVNLLHALRPMIEGQLRSRGHDEACNRRKCKYLEDRSVAILREALHPSAVFGQLYYYDGDKRYETDGLLVVETTAIIVEAKAGALTAPSLRAAPDRLKRDLKKLMLDSSEQAERIQALIERDKQLHVEINGRRDVIPLSHVRRVLTIAVTLEDMMLLGQYPDALVDAEILEESEARPRFISLHDLEIIVELCEFGAELVHYLVRRQGIDRLKAVRTSDELDYFAYYLERGLYLNDELSKEGAPDVYMIGTMTDDIELYYLWKEGIRTKPAKKPVQKMHREYRRILALLDGERPPGYLETSLYLLGLGGGAREGIAQTVVRMRNQTLRDGDFHDMSTVFYGPPSIGLTIMVGPSDSPGQLREKLQYYTPMKKYQTKTDYWTGLGILVGQPGAFQVYVHHDDEWKPDPKLDEVLATLPLREMVRPDESGKIPPRAWRSPKLETRDLVLRAEEPNDDTDGGGAEAP